MKLVVRIAEKSGLPYTWVPANTIWHFAQYLESQRHDVRYGYCYSSKGFTVNFHRMNMKAVQKLLEDWEAAVAEMIQEVVEEETRQSEEGVLCGAAT